MGYKIFTNSSVRYGKNEIHRGEYYVAEESHYGVKLE